MNTIHNIIKNFSALSIAQLSSLLLGLILSVYIARVLGDVDFGQFSFAIAFVSLFAIFSDLGYNTLIIREVARDKSKANAYLNNVLSLRILLCFFIYIMIILSVNFLNYPFESKNLVYVFGASVLIDSLADVFNVLFRAFEKMEYEATTAVYYSLAKISIGLLVLHLGYGLLSLGLVFIILSIFRFYRLFSICKKSFLNPKLRFDLEFWKRTLIIALPFSMTGISLLIYTRTDTVMLSYMKGDAAVGWYNAAYNLILSFKPIPQIFMNTLFPLMAGSFLTSKDMFNEICEISFKFLILLGLPLTMGIFMLSDKIIYLIYGYQFSNSIIALRILSFDIILFFIWTHLAFVLINIDRQKLWLFAAITTAFINIILNLYLIPSYSYIGSSVATIISEMLCIIILLFFIFRKTKLSLDYNSMLKIAISTMMMMIFIYAFKELNIYLLIFISIFIYSLSAYSIGAISREEINIIRKGAKIGK